MCLDTRIRQHVLKLQPIHPDRLSTCNELHRLSGIGRTTNERNRDSDRPPCWKRSSPRIQVGCADARKRLQQYVQASKRSAGVEEYRRAFGSKKISSSWFDRSNIGPIALRMTAICSGLI